MLVSGYNKFGLNSSLLLCQFHNTVPVKEYLLKSAPLDPLVKTGTVWANRYNRPKTPAVWLCVANYPDSVYCSGGIVPLYC